MRKQPKREHAASSLVRTLPNRLDQPSAVIRQTSHALKADNDTVNRETRADLTRAATKALRIDPKNWQMIRQKFAFVASRFIIRIMECRVGLRRASLYYAWRYYTYFTGRALMSRGRSGRQRGLPVRNTAGNIFL